MHNDSSNGNLKFDESVHTNLILHYLTQLVAWCMEGVEMGSGWGWDKVQDDGRGQP